MPNHMRRTHPECQLHCLMCGDRFRGPGGVNKHMLAQHRDELKPSIQRTISKFERSQNVASKKSAPDEQEGEGAGESVGYLQCSHCPDSSFNSLTDMILHLRTEHDIHAQHSLHYKKAGDIGVPQLIMRGLEEEERKATQMMVEARRSVNALSVRVPRVRAGPS